MPTYEYKCSACGHTFERFQSITAPAITRCPECGKAKVKRLLGTGAGVIFKGSGFYTTDYRSDAYKNAAKSDSGGSGVDSKDAKPAESGSGSKDAKPAVPAPAPAAKPEPAPAARSDSSKSESSKSRKKK